MVPGGHPSVILVVIIGFRQWGARKGQNMAQNGPHVYIYIYINTKLLALEPSRGPKIGHGSQEKTKINWGNRLESISGVLEPFKCLYRAPKPIVLHLLLVVDFETQHTWSPFSSSILSGESRPHSVVNCH